MCVCVCVFGWHAYALLKDSAGTLCPTISSFHILQGCTTSLTLNPWKNKTLFISGVREESVAVKQDVVKGNYSDLFDFYFEGGLH